MNARWNVISETGDGLGFAVRLKDEGERVRMWIRSSDAVQIGNGLIDKVGDFEDLVKDATVDEDIFLFDGSGNGFVADALREQGFAVLGGSLVADRLERDRSFGLNVMTDAGISVPETYKFSSWNEARSFVDDYPGRLVYKPSKALGDISSSHVSSDKEELLDMLANFEKGSSVEKPEFELQEFIEGVCISTELWFDGNKFLNLWNHTFERKQLMNDDLGPSGGCTGNIVWACGSCQVCHEVKKLESWLRHQQFLGMLDLNAVVNDEGFYGLEFTPRFGYDASPTMFNELLEDSSVAETLAYVAKHHPLAQTLSLKKGKLAGGIRLTIPPWPLEKYDADADIPIRGLEESELRHTYFYNVKSGGEAKLASAGAWGILLLFTYLGTSVASALRYPALLCEKVRVPDKQYRTDLVAQFKGDFEKLKAVLGAEVSLG